MSGTRPAVMSSPIVALFHKMRAGDEGALDELMPQVYGELRRMARLFMRRQRPGHTLQPTALVNEAFIKLFDDAQPVFEDRAHFLALMARVMRQVLVCPPKIGFGSKPSQLRISQMIVESTKISPRSKSNRK